MGSIRGAAPQALPILCVTFKTSSVSSWWWDLFFILFFFPFARTQKLKSLKCFLWASPHHRALFLQGHWEINWESFPALMVLWFCVLEAVGRQSTWSPAPPTHLWAPSSVSALLLWQKWRKWGFVPWGSICAFQIHFQTESSLPPSLGWIIVHTGFTAVLVALRSTDSSWAGWSQGNFLPQLRNILDNIFLLVPVVISRKCSLWIPRADFCLLRGIDGNDAFIQDYHPKVLIFGDILRGNLENCIYKSGVFKTNQKRWWYPEVLGVWM